MRRVSFLLLILLWCAASTPLARAQTKAEKVMYGITLTGAGVTYAGDISSTRRGLELGFVEGNPVLAKEDGTPRYWLKTAMAGTVVTVAHFGLWKRGHYRKAIAANAILTVAQGIAWGLNERNIRLVTVPAPEPLPARGARFTIRF